MPWRCHDASFSCGRLLTVAAWLAVPELDAARISTDGSVGPARALAGPNFMIGAPISASRTDGSLFHSFNTFNLQTGKSATFTEPGNVTNVIGRVRTAVSFL
jgi:hypothetical protein